MIYMIPKTPRNGAPNGWTNENFMSIDLHNKVIGLKDISL